MNIYEAVKYVGERFVYESDPTTIGDTWQVLRLNDEKFTGDCDDFALTCFWYVSDQNILRFVLHTFITHKYKLYRCKTINNEWHVVGSFDGLWFDNWTQEALVRAKFFEKTKHTIKMRYLSPMILYFMFVGLFK
jgi:hypothetical protein